MDINTITEIQTVVSIIAAAAAIFTLSLQRKEIKRSAEITALSGLAQILEQRISQDQKIVDGLRANGEPWQGLAYRINNELRPALEKTQKALIDILNKYKPDLELQDIRNALKRKNDE